MASETTPRRRRRPRGASTHDETIERWDEELNEVYAAFSSRVGAVVARTKAADAAADRAKAWGRAPTRAMLLSIILEAAEIEKATRWMQNEAADRMHRLARAVIDNPEARQRAHDLAEKFRAAREADVETTLREFRAVLPTIARPSLRRAAKRRSEGGA